MRRGITLLEVLISMFVMLVGLLGVASLLTVGKHLGSSGTKADRSSACGRAAFRDLKVRGMLNPKSWALVDGDAVYDSSTSLACFDGATAAGSRVHTIGVPAFCLDPLGVTAGFGPWFPTNGTTTPSVATNSPQAPPLPPYLPRITGIAPNAAARDALADSIFRWQDDLAFDTPAADDKLPSQTLQGNSKRLSTGDYSWLATVCPDPAMVTSDPSSIPYRVSIVVFYKRDLISAANGERVCKLSAISGDGEITLTTNGASPLTVNAADHLKIAKPNQWMMLVGSQMVDHDRNPLTAMVQGWQFSWYRIVAADDIVQSGSDYERRLTVAGPDWVANPSSVTAFLFDGITAVYEKNMNLESDSIY